MVNDLAYLIRQLPTPIRLPLAFFIAFVLPAPLFSEAIRLLRNSNTHVTFPANIFFWVYGGGFQSWLTDGVRIAGMLLIVAVIVIPVAFAGTSLWWYFGPGAMERRKKARRELRGRLGAFHIQDAWEKANDPTPNLSWFSVRPTWTHHKPKPSKASSPPVDEYPQKAVDREAFERETRRWD